MKRVRSICAAMLMATTLGGCSTISGMQKPVVGVEDAVAIPPEYKRDAAMTAMKDLTGDDAVQLRNAVIGIYLNAIDARYHEFRGNLSRDVRRSNLGLDLGAQAASTLGAIAKGSANELSALAALLVGSRASVNKELYYERTLPALVATMDANRIKARTGIVSHLNDPITTYPLSLAFADLANYELAGNLDSAVNQLSVVAGEARAEEFRTYDNVIESCQPSRDVASYRGMLNRNFYALAEPDTAGKLVDENVVALVEIAKLFGVEAPEKAATAEQAAKQVVAINRAVVSSLCTVDQAKAKIVKIKAIEDGKVKIPEGALLKGEG